MELEPCDFLNIFLKFWPFEPHFLINFFLVKKRVCNKYLDWIIKNLETESSKQIGDRKIFMVAKITYYHINRRFNQIQVKSTGLLLH